MEVKRFLKDHDLILTRADKGNSITILRREQYVDKMNDFLQINSEDVGSFEVIEDPSVIHNEEIKDLVSEFNQLSQTPWFYENMNPKPPELYGLVKLHKPDQKIRPVVSCSGTGTEKVAKKALELFNSWVPFHSEYSIKNREGIIEKLKNTSLASGKHTLVSVDVSSLFPSINMNKLKNILEELIFSKMSDKIKAQFLLNLIYSCLDWNYFRFNGIVYKQKKGLAIGSPLSPLLAEVYMNHLEKIHIFNGNSTSIKSVKFYVRYIDDTFLIFQGSQRQIDNFLKFLNTIDPDIKFTHEIERDGKLNFLDLTISLDKDNKAQFQIYRKDSFTDCVIPRDSNHPWPYKLAAFRSMVHRLKSVPLSEHSFNAEVHMIKTIARNNGYNPNIVENLIRTFDRKQINEAFQGHLKPFPEELRYRRVVYLNKSSLCIKNQLLELGIKPAFYTNTTISKLNNSKLSNRELTSESGIYRMKCGGKDGETCNGEYVGQSGRKVSVREGEHLGKYRSILKRKEKMNECIETIAVCEELGLSQQTKEIALNNMRSLKIEITDLEGKSAFAKHLYRAGHEYEGEFDLVHKLDQKGMGMV
uniref:Putative COX1/OXI3 intron 1 protein n=1 Tax=Lygus hesperus TaxID=30085 RepID=A0A0A9WSN7_LYGHE